jgi:hypothetical protein
VRVNLVIISIEAFAAKAPISAKSNTELVRANTLDVDLSEAVVVEIHEVVLTYAQAQLDAWLSGDRSLIPSFVEVGPKFANMPKFHFGEMLVLRHYHETAGWKGFAAYALGPQYPKSRRRISGRRKVEDIVPRTLLQRLRTLRSSPAELRFGGGEPDLFLYSEDGQYKFVEVKKQRDRLSQAQLRCIAQIMRVLSCDVDIVYLRERRQPYKPKVYCFDLRSFTGWRKT